MVVPSAKTDLVISDIKSIIYIYKISDQSTHVTDLNNPANHSRTVPKSIKYRKLNVINIATFKKIPKILNELKVSKLGVALAKLQHQCHTISPASSLIFTLPAYQNRPHLHEANQPMDYPRHLFWPLKGTVDTLTATGVKARLL